MFNNIQLLRAVAAIAVALFHIIGHYKAIGESPAWVLSAMGVGYVGVDLFFVISGFVMMHVLRGPAGARGAIAFLRGFLLRRFVRIYGWYWPCLLFTLVVILVFDPAGFATINWARSVSLTSVHLPELALGPSWSLTYELYFYTLISLLWLCFARRIELVLWAGIALLWGLNTWTRWDEGSLMSFLTAPFLIEFLVGGLLYVYRIHLAKPVVCVVVLAAAVVLIRWGLMSNATNGFLRLQSFGLGAACVVSLLVSLEANGWFKAGKISTWVGDASYSIYLLHLPFISLFYWLGTRRWLESIGGVGAQIGFFAILVGFVALCVALHRWLELPLYRMLCRRLDAPSSQTAGRRLSGIT
jgi:exopolysaccharide production protein ExoZ